MYHLLIIKLCYDMSSTYLLIILDKHNGDDSLQSPLTLPDQVLAIEIFNLLILANICEIWFSCNMHLVCRNLEGWAFKQKALDLTTSPTDVTS